VKRAVQSAPLWMYLIFLTALTRDQRQAVGSALGAALVLAGAGSGKTRVLVHRVRVADPGRGCSPKQYLGGHLHQQGRRRNAQPASKNPVGVAQRRPWWLGTFHGLAHRLLRIHWRESGHCRKAFRFWTPKTRRGVLRKVLKALDLDETRWIPREILWFINAQKDEGLRPKAHQG